MYPQKVLITGGAGFLGQHLVEAIVAKWPQAKIKILDIKIPPLPYFSFSKNENIEVQLNADVVDYNRIEPEFKEVDLVFHLADYSSFWTKDRRWMYEVNVDGTHNVVHACLKHQVKKLVHCSSVLAIGSSEFNMTLNEEYNPDWKKFENKAYMFTKHLAEQEVAKGLDKGLDAVIANPGIIYGPGDLQRSISFFHWSLYSNFKGYYFPGGSSMSDVRDTARGFLQLADQGRSGERYILGGFNWSFKDVQSLVTRLVDQPPPQKALPRWMQLPIYSSFRMKWGSWISKRPLNFSPDLLDAGFKRHWYDSSKAFREIGWKMNYNLFQTFQEAYDWYSTNHLL